MNEQNISNGAKVWTKEEMQRLAPDVEPPSVDGNSNWGIVYVKLLEARKEIEDMKEEVKHLSWDKDLSDFQD